MPISRNAFLGGTEIPLMPVSVTRSTSGTVIATPAKGHIVIVMFQFQNEDSTAGTLVARNGPTEWWRVRGQNQGDGCGYPVAGAIHLNEGLDFNVTISAGTWGISALYYIEI